MSDIVERIRKLRYVHGLGHVFADVANELMAEAVTEIDRLQEIVSRYTDGISAIAESNQPHKENDEKRGVADMDRATLTDAERAAIEFFAAIHADDDPPHEYAVILRNLLERLA